MQVCKPTSAEQRANKMQEDQVLLRFFGDGGSYAPLEDCDVCTWGSMSGQHCSTDSELAAAAIMAENALQCGAVFV